MIQKKETVTNQELESREKTAATDNKAGGDKPSSTDPKTGTSAQWPSTSESENK